MFFRRVLACLLVVLSFSFAADAFTPPEDTAGPLTVRIEGPEKVTETDTPLPVRVHLKNKGESALTGELRVQVIDTWRVEPSNAVPFSVEANAESVVEFTATAGKGAYNALYPVHAFAKFRANDAEIVAHPILITEVLLKEVPRPPDTSTWKPVAVSAAGVALLRNSTCRAVISVPGQAPRVLSVGWRGTDGPTGGSMVTNATPGRPDERQALGIHPPYRDGQVGSLWVEYPLTLPAEPLQLRFANAIRDHTGTEPPSDGVTFRVRAVPFDAPDDQAGDVLFDHHTDAKTWQEATVDLAAYAGKTIRLILESHPGPKNDPTCDQSFWAGPRLVSATPPPPAEVQPLQALGEIRAADQTYRVSFRLGRRGILDGEILFESGARSLSFQGFPTQVMDESLEQEGGVTECLKVVDESDAHMRRFRHCFRSADKTFDLVTDLFVENGRALRAAFRLENAPPDKPWSATYIDSVTPGPWSKKASQVYASVGNVLRNPEPFVLWFDGHRMATSFVGFDFDGGPALVQGVDVPPTQLVVTPDRKVYALQAGISPTMTFIPAENVCDAVAVWRDINGLKPAGGVAKLAGRFVFDLWGGDYANSARALEKAFAYGLTDSVVVWHNWQRWGYDYRLADIYPPNPDLGTLEQFKDLCNTCKKNRVLFAPHDNYIDVYPDSDGFSYRNVAFTAARDPVRAWLNEGRGAQSFRWRTDAYGPFMERNLKLIRENVAPTGYFIDVFSSIGPYNAWTEDGMFQSRVFTRDTWGKTFAWIREYLGDNAPQISESGHDQLIGYLDGAQTNHLRAGNPQPDGMWMVWNVKAEDDERIPWLDMAHHDRFVLHGAGYSYRYCAGLNGDLHGIFSDDYIATEVMTGHPAMVPDPFGRDVVRKYWLLHDPMRLLAIKKMDRFEFVENNLHNQHIRWQDGTDVWVNRGDTDWTVEGHVLPQYGFYVRGAGVEAAIDRRDGVIVEWNRSLENVFVNARPMAGDKQPVRVAAESVKYLGDRNVEITFAWTASRPLQHDVNIFVHFTDSAGKIVFQADHNPPIPSTQWQGTVKTTVRPTLPPAATPGSAFGLGVGLWRPDIGRLAIMGPDDGDRRIRLGELKIEGQEANVTGIAWTPASQEDPVLARCNPEGKVVDFGLVKTNGAFRLTRAADVLVVTPLPGSSAFTAHFDAQLMPFGVPVPAAAEPVAEDGAIGAAIALKREGDSIVFDCPGNAFQYALTVE